MATTVSKSAGATKRDILELLKKQDVAFLRLQFTDILGVNKNVEVPQSQFEKALEGDVMFDGSSIEGFVRIQESDRVLSPDLVTPQDLLAMGFEVEAGHHGVAPGQHEIDFRYAEALETADNLATFRFIVRYAAYRHGFLATFMPKPIFGINGSGMHTHQSLFRDGKNAFHDPKGKWELSQTALHYIAGLLRHARGFCAVTNPLVNSYKRLVPGYEAPTNVAWSMRNRSPLIRIPDRRGMRTRCELRMPDPSANPYLALAVQLGAGLSGIESKLLPPDPVNKNIFEMSFRERRKYRIDELPRDLHEALEMLEKDAVVRDALGEHIYERFVEAKREEWQGDIGRVSEWELKRDLGQY